MKQIILIILLIFSSYSCGLLDTSDPKICKTDRDCFENIGEGLVCLNKECFEDKCNTQNIDCGPVGKCEMIPFYAECICNEGVYKNNHSFPDLCYEEYTCKTSKDCKYISITGGEETRICSPEGICTDKCETSLDCKGENEVCIYGERCYEAPKDDEINENRFWVSRCDEDYYNDHYNNLSCAHECDDEEYICRAGFTCKNKQCIPRCLTNEDCLEDKFTGDICDETLKVCVD